MMYDIDIMLLTACGLLPRTLRIWGPHEHPSYELHYVIAGRASFELRGARVDVRPGDFVYTRPATMHRMDVPEGEYLLQYVAFVELDPEHDEALANDLDTQIGEGQVLRIGDRYHGLFARLSRQSLSDDARSRRAASAKMADFLYEMMVDTRASPGSHPAIEQALDFMGSHIDETFALDELVEQLDLDKSYFIRLFKKNIGVPPMKYAMNLKMSAAADLLRTTNDPIATVAAQVGFDDAYHFAKRFKQWSGVAPGAFRKQ